MPSGPIELRFPRVVRYRFVVEALTSIEVPAYAGSAWRGLIGGALRRTACITHQPTCDACLVSGNCAFFRLFEIASPPADAPRGHTPTHPFVLHLEEQGARECRVGETLMFGINLIGDAAGLLPNLVYALLRAGEAGLGRGRGQFGLRTVLQEQSLGQDDWSPIFDAAGGSLAPLGSGPVAIPAPPAAVSVTLLTPLRIKRFGRFVGPAEFQAADFLRHLCWRLDTLDRQFSSETAQGVWERHREAIDQAPAAQARLRWLDWTRYSSRQATKMQFGGLVGDLILPTKIAHTLWPWLWLGQWVHVGKNTSFGLGAYRLHGTGP